MSQIDMGSRELAPGNQRTSRLQVLDLFSAAAGGWSLGMHRAGFETVAACEVEAWRRALYSENNPKVRMYDDVRTVTADRLVRDLGFFPPYVVGSPPCQDISSANTKGQGVDGERSGLFFEAARIIGEGRPRGFALENSANLRTKGADRVLAALESLGYACWSFVVGAGDGKRCAGVGANHERARAWIIGFDVDQITDPDGVRWDAGRSGRRSGLDLSISDDPLDAPRVGHEGRRSRRHRPDGVGEASASRGGETPSDADQAGQADGRMVAGLRQAEISRSGCGAERRDDGDAPQDGRGARRARRRAEPASGLSVETRRNAAGPHANDEGQPDGAEHDEVGWGSSTGGDASGPWSEWNGGLADHLRVDDGLSAWVAQSRIAVGGPRGTSGASLIVEAFGDAVIPQIPEAIGRAILRTEAALAAIYGQAA